MHCPKALRTAIVVIVFACCAESRAAELDWKPAKTWVFCVGLLQWQQPELWSSFPACMPDRRDEQLVEYFREAGVPEDQITYLQDAEATKAHIQQEFAELLDSTDEGDLLIFYFCGHGYRDSDTGQTWFANYDAGKNTSSAWSVRDIFKSIEKRFSGNRALLLADCCHSGALYDESRKYSDSDVAYAVLTSSYSHNSSTGNWTFSDSVLAGLRGEAVVDLNQDEYVELDEIARYTELELAFIEGQKSMFTAVPRFPRQAKLVEVEDELEPRVGQRIEVLYEGKWYRAKVIDVDGDQLKVHYVNFDDSWDAWVGLEKVRPYQPAQFAEGDQVKVLWKDGKWYPARVRKAWYGLHLVRYDGFDSSADEWCGPSAIRLRTE